MSHEGIRFVSAEEVLRDSAQAAAHQGEGLSVDAVTPLKVRVKKSEGTGVEIDWRDGHQSSWNFRWLRDACPCATCNAERETTGRATGEPKPKPHDPLALYQAPPRPDEVTPVGRYALSFKWNDGHQSGIYSWTYLRSVCQCPLCNLPRSS
jgi:DUF971 family protein